MDRKSMVKEFLVKISRKTDFKDDEDIMNSGLLNSLFAMQLILFLEKKFNISIGKEDFNLENFKSLNAITKYLDMKMG